MPSRASSGNALHRSVSMTGAAVAEKKTKAAIARAISGKLAGRVATLFYDHNLDDFGHEK
ncbi:MAG: hypothetical protein IH987_20125 [Planctomycetes bacterium]|nr:hypothetical protein [Planctomycetota bacterium]